MKINHHSFLFVLTLLTVIEFLLIAPYLYRGLESGGPQAGPSVPKSAFEMVYECSGGMDLRSANPFARLCIWVGRHQRIRVSATIVICIALMVVETCKKVAGGTKQLVYLSVLGSCLFFAFIMIVNFIMLTINLGPR